MSEGCLAAAVALTGMSPTAEAQVMDGATIIHAEAIGPAVTGPDAERGRMATAASSCCERPTST